MRLLVITDIFGKTSAFLKLVENFKLLFDSIELIDPYGGKDVNFQNEKEAYSQFQQTVGLENYAQIVHEYLDLSKDRSALYILAFSVGASAIWKLSASIEKNAVHKVVCFYSSQIRNFMQIQPGVTVELYFAKEEATYDVDNVMTILAKKNNVFCHKTKFHHGFMNEKSVHFNQVGYLHYIKHIKYHISSSDLLV